jgi:hypothetical protein
MGGAGGNQGGNSDTDSQAILVEPFIPPPRRAPSGPRVLIKSPTIDQHGFFAEDGPRHVLVESPRSHDLGSLRSHPSQETLGGFTYRSAGSSNEHLAPPKHKPSILDSSRLAYHGNLDALTTSSTNDVCRLQSYPRCLILRLFISSRHPSSRQPLQNGNNRSPPNFLPFHFRCHLPVDP